MEQVKFDARHCRKKAPKGVPHPERSERFKALWATPEFRAKMEKVFAARRADPEKRWSRKGIPDGYTRKRANKMWKEARKRARAVLDKLIEKKVFDTSNMPQTDAEAAEAAMHESLTIMFSATQIEHKLRAANQVLTFTKAKPEQKKAITVKSAEDWLAEVVEDDEKE